VLVTLTIQYTLMLVQAASSRILFGMSQHGTFRPPCKRKKTMRYSICAFLTAR